MKMHGVFRKSKLPPPNFMINASKPGPFQNRKRILARLCERSERLSGIAVVRSRKAMAIAGVRVAATSLLPRRRPVVVVVFAMDEGVLVAEVEIVAQGGGWTFRWQHRCIPNGGLHRHKKRQIR